MLGGKKCSLFGKFGMLCFLVTSVLLLTLLPYHRIFICLIYRNILPLNDAACLQKEAQKSGFSKVSHLLQYFLRKVVRDTKGFHFIRLHCLRYFPENVSKNFYNQTSRWNFFGGK